MRFAPTTYPPDTLLPRLEADYVIADYVVAGYVLSLRDTPSAYSIDERQPNSTINIPHSVLVGL